jgi:signal transduction histidine kinase
MVKWRKRRSEGPVDELVALRAAAARARVLVEESREIVVVLDGDRRVLAASRRARESLEGLEEGAPFPDELLRPDGKREPIEIPYDVAGRRERLIYLGSPGDLAAYEELRAGFTAAVSHELRTPLARLLVLVEGLSLPGADPEALTRQARAEVEQMRELIDDVLFLSELETGRQVVSLGSTEVEPVVREVLGELAPRAERAGVTLRAQVDGTIAVPMRPRMLRVVLENLVGNSIRYAGEGSTCTVSAAVVNGEVMLTVADDGVGVDEESLPRLFERFYRADQARASRGTGLGLAIVKHVVGAAGGSVEAMRVPNRGLTIRCRLPVP